MTTTEAPHLPEVLLLPTVTATRPGEQAQLALCTTTDGELVASAYSTLGRLVAGAGGHQPWVALPAADLTAVLADAGVRHLLLDVPLRAQESGGA